MYVAFLQDGIGDIAAKYGLGVAIAAATLWFLAFKVWPWMTSRVEEADKARELDRIANRQDRESHQKNLESVGKQMELLGEKTVKALDEVVDKLDAMHQDIRQIKDNKRQR